MGTCKTCGRPMPAHGRCQRHKPFRSCDLCERQHYGRGLCNRHYGEKILGRVARKTRDLALAEKLEINSERVPEAGCHIWVASVDSHGYGQIWSGGKLVSAHVAAFELAFGSIDGGSHVLHRCDVPSCINPQHLFLGSQKKNMQDASHKGRVVRGENHYCAKLTERDVLEIYADQRPERIVAPNYGISARTVYSIRIGKNWRWLTQSTSRGLG